MLVVRGVKEGPNDGFKHFVLSLLGNSKYRSTLLN